MAAQWISDGTEVPEGAVALKPPPRGRVWRFAGLELARAPRRGRWSCQTTGDPSVRSDGLVMAGTLPAVGVAGARTPFGAILPVLRMVRNG
jgi:hypothetical protein